MWQFRVLNLEKSTKWGSEAWVDHISDKQLPALSSTVRTLEHLVKDDTVSLAKLGQSVLHDYALTSSILRVANSAAYMGRNQVTTVSRAAVVLGYGTIKNICITAKLLGSLLDNNNLTEAVYIRILKQMAQSFHAGMLTQALLPDLSENKREEIFISALLHHIGESAFWCSGGLITEHMDEQLKHIDPADSIEVDMIVRKELGTTFNEISIGLADSWNLGDNFIATIKDPKNYTKESNIVSLADELSIAIANPSKNKIRLKKLLEQIGDATGLKPETLKSTIEQCTKKTEELLESYGAGVLVQYLHPGATALPNPESEGLPQNDEKLQLQILRELTALTTEGGDFNVVIQTALEGIYRGIGMDKVIIMVKNNQKKVLEPRFISGEKSQQLKELFCLNLNTAENVFTYALKNAESVWVAQFDDPNWHKLITKPVRNITHNDGFFLAPVMWDKHCIGLIYADRYNRKHNKRDKLNIDDYNAFLHFAQQTNLCLSIILRRG